MSGPVCVSVFGKTDLGQSRDHNEDTFFVADLGTGSSKLLQGVEQYEVGERGVLFMVADGMGGAAAGELASSMATESIWRHLRSTWAFDEEVTPLRFASRIRDAVDVANEELYRHAQENEQLRGMGTTVTLAGLVGDALYLAQIGDSRAYLIRGGATTQLTRDQSLTQRLVDAGELTEEEAEKSERRNIILQALGPDPEVRVDLSRQQLRHGDVLVMCSDGLSGLVKKDEIGELAARTPGLADLCGALIDLANSRGGPDNITVVAARFDGDGLAPPDAKELIGYEMFAVEVGRAAVPEPPAEPMVVAPEARRGVSPRSILVGAIVVALVFLGWALLR